MLGLRDVKIKVTLSNDPGRSSSIQETNKLNIAVQVISAIKEVRGKDIRRTEKGGLGMCELQF